MSRRRAMLIVGLTALVLIAGGAWLLLPPRTGTMAIEVSGPTGTKFQGSSQRVDWLVTPVAAPVKVEVNDDRKQLILGNGLVRRTWRLAPNAACTSFTRLDTG